MYIIQNAAANLWRNKGRNILIFLITLAIIAVCSIALTIRNTTEAITKQYKDRFSSEVFIRQDMEKMQKEAQEGSDFSGMMSFSTPEMIPSSVYMKIAESKYLKGTSFTNSMPAISSGLTPIKPENQQDGGIMSSQIIGGGDGQMEMEDMQYMIHGYSDVTRDENFKNKKRILSKGDYPKKDGEVMISQMLAEKNNLNIGDTIEVKSYITKTEEGRIPDSLTLKISGFYQITDPNKQGMSFSIPENDMYAYYTTIAKEEVNPNVVLSASYFLKSPKDIDAFAKECYKLGVSDDYLITTDTDTYNAIVGSVEELGNVAYIFLWFIVILGAALLILLSLLTNRERKYEVGVLRAMGMKKTQIMRQMIYESLCLVLLALCIGLPLGTITSQPIADTMMEKQNEKMSGLNNGSMNIVMSGSVSNQDKIEKIKVSTDTTTILQSCAIGILLVIVSSSMSILYITKYEPIRILSERS